MGSWTQKVLCNHCFDSIEFIWLLSIQIWSNLDEKHLLLRWSILPWNRFIEIFTNVLLFIIIYVSTYVACFAEMTLVYLNFFWILNDVRMHVITANLLIIVPFATSRTTSFTEIDKNNIGRTEQSSVENIRFMMRFVFYLSTLMTFIHSDTWIDGKHIIILITLWMENISMLQHNNWYMSNVFVLRSFHLGFEIRCNQISYCRNICGVFYVMIVMESFFSPTLHFYFQYFSMLFLWYTTKLQADKNKSIF